MKYTRADGTITEYRYSAYGSAPAPKPDTIEHLMLSYERSPEWRKLKASSKLVYTHYLQFLGGIGHLLVKDIDRRSILELRDAMANDRGDGAGNSFMNAIGALFAWALKRGWIEYSPCTRIEPLQRTPYPTWSMQLIELALDHLPDELCRAVILALYTGQRRSDVVRMTWADYDGEHIKVRQEKTGTALVLPCHRYLQECLGAWKAEAVVTPTILHNSRGKPWRADGLSNSMQAALRRVPGFPAGHNMHGLRKAAATMLAEAGCSAHEIMSVTGHKSLREVERYTTAARQQVLAAEAVPHLPDLSFRKRGTNLQKTGQNLAVFRRIKDEPDQ